MAVQNDKNGKKQEEELQPEEEEPMELDEFVQELLMAVGVDDLEDGHL